MRRAKVIEPYQAQYKNPIRFASGSVVTIGEKDTQWPDWIWTTTSDGNSGWAPIGWLKLLGDGRAEALRDYSAQEATLESGDEAGFCWEYGGWCWVIRDMQTFGWVPASHLEVGPDEPEPELSKVEVATGWINYWVHGGPYDPEASEPYGGEVFDLDLWAREEPEKAWETILEIQRRPEAEPHLEVLAAGPLEDLLSYNGPAFIDRVEAEAKRSPDFAFLLGGVWQCGMSNEVWARVQAVWDRKGWDGIPRDDVAHGGVSHEHQDK